MPDTRVIQLPKVERERVAQARTELSQTVISRIVARALVMAFVVGLLLPHVAQLTLDPQFYRSASFGSPTGRETRDTAQWFARLRAFNRAMLQKMQAFENSLADESAIGRHVRPVVQRAMTTWLTAGNAQVELGNSGWLFYRPDIDHVTGPGFLSTQHLARRASMGNTLETTPYPDPRPALLALRDQLTDRNITLIVMPTPVKPSVEPDRIAGGYARNRSVTNRSYRRFLDELDTARIRVFDVTESLTAMRREGTEMLYLRTDTHWRPETMTRVATDLARVIEASVDLDVTGTEQRYQVTAETVTNRGDTEALLGLGPQSGLFLPETVSISPVATATGEAWAPDQTAEVLLLGDSFTNVYSLAALGWGQGAGFAEQLSVALDRPVDRLSQNDDGAGAPRRLLAAALIRNPTRLAHTRVVVYQFATRELSQGNWHTVHLAPSTNSSALALWAPTAGDTATVVATIAAIGTVPRPGTVPYRDHIVAIHLTNIDQLAGPEPGARRDALVYARSMIDNELTEIAAYRPGDGIQLRLEPWAAVAPELDGITRAELENMALIRAVPWWGTLEVATP